MIRILIFIGLKLWDLLRLIYIIIKFPFYKMWKRLFRCIREGMEVFILGSATFSPLIIMPIIWAIRGGNWEKGFTYGIGLTFVIFWGCMVYVATGEEIKKFFKSNWLKAGRIEKKWRKK